MKRLASSESGPRFQAQIRHYHRTSPSKEGSWDQWVDGGQPPSSRRRMALIKRVLVIVAVLAALGALVAGFINIA